MTSQTHHEHSTPVVISSCRKYNSVLSVVLDRLHDLGIANIHVVSDADEIESRSSGVNHLKMTDNGWSANLLALLNSINAPYLFLWIDDLYPANLTASQLLDAATLMHDEDLDVMQLCGAGLEYMPFGYRKSTSHKLVHLPLYSPYRITTVGGMWRKEFLAQLLRDSESAWQFEINGNWRALGRGRIAAARFECIDYINIMIKGTMTEKGRAIISGAQVSSLESDRLVKNKWLGRVSAISPSVAAYLQFYFWQVRNR